MFSEVNKAIIKYLENQMFKRLKQIERDIALLQEEKAKIEKEIREDNKLPSINVGQVYLIKTSFGSEFFMVASIGGATGKSYAGLTVIANAFHASGCFSSNVCSGYYSREDLRKILKKHKAEYLGMFYDLYERKS